MIVSFLLRAALIYFLWRLGRKLWHAYKLAKSIQNTHSKPQGPGQKYNGQSVDAEFRVLREQD